MNTDTCYTCIIMYLASFGPDQSTFVSTRLLCHRRRCRRHRRRRQRLRRRRRRRRGRRPVTVDELNVTAAVQLIARTAQAAAPTTVAITIVVVIVDATAHIVIVVMAIQSMMMATARRCRRRRRCWRRCRGQSPKCRRRICCRSAQLAVQRVGKIPERIDLAEQLAVVVEHQSDAVALLGDDGSLDDSRRGGRRCGGRCDAFLPVHLDGLRVADQSGFLRRNRRRI